MSFYRVEHAFMTYEDYNIKIGVGPYNYVRTYDGIHSEYRTVRNLAGRLFMNEDRPKRFKNPGFLSNIPLPATFISNRPGPREDPEMRHEFVNRYLGGNVRHARPNWAIMFGFDSKDQLRRWFDDPVEWDLLEKCRFTINRYVVPTKDVMIGRCQCVWDVSEHKKHKAEQLEFHLTD
jgi:hypothetical protein